jgi:hypothetical protein
MPLAPVSGWIIACSAGRCSFHDMTLNHRSSRRILGPAHWGRNCPVHARIKGGQMTSIPPPRTNLSTTYHTGPHSAAPAACPSTQYRPTTCAACISKWLDHGGQTDVGIFIHGLLHACPVGSCALAAGLLASCPVPFRAHPPPVWPHTHTHPCSTPCSAASLPN